MSLSGPFAFGFPVVPKSIEEEISLAGYLRDASEFIINIFIN